MHLALISKGMVFEGFVAPKAAMVLAEVAQPLQTFILFPHLRPARFVALSTTLILNLSTRYCTASSRDEYIRVSPVRAL